MVRASIVTRALNTEKYIVFLGDNARKSETKRYPIAKMGDFGLARPVKSPHPKGNPYHHFEGGSLLYMAPVFEACPSSSTLMAYQEQRYSLQTDRQHQGRPMLEFTSKTNVWSIAATMYELLTLRELFYDYKNPKTGFKRRLSDPWLTIVEIKTTHQPKEYSNELRSLIRDCLKEKPAARPTLQEVRERMTAGQRRHCNRKFTAADRVYYKGNDIGNMKHHQDYKPQMHEIEIDMERGQSVETNILRGQNDPPPLHFPRHSDETPGRSSLASMIRNERHRFISERIRPSGWELMNDSRFRVLTPPPEGPSRASSDDDGGN